MLGDSFDQVLAQIRTSFFGSGWKLLLLAICLYGMYRLLPKPERWKMDMRKRMEKTFKRTGLFIEDKKGGKMEKLLPDFESLTDDGSYYEFRFKLIPGLTLKQFMDKKAYIEAAFNAETFVTGSGSNLTIRIAKLKQSTIAI